jgi:hypothetical protein
MSCLIPQIMLTMENPLPGIKSMLLEREEDEKTGINAFEEVPDHEGRLPNHFSTNQKMFEFRKDFKT